MIAICFPDPARISLFQGRNFNDFLAKSCKRAPSFIRSNKKMNPVIFFQSLSFFPRCKKGTDFLQITSKHVKEKKNDDSKVVVVDDKMEGETCKVQ